MLLLELYAKPVLCICLNTLRPCLKAHNALWLAQTIFYINYIVTVIFVLEMVLKILACGFIMHPGSYMRDNWNILDFIIVIASILSVTITSTRFVNGLRALRALRPLRLVSNFQSTRTVLGAILGSFKSMINVVIFGVLLFNVFSVIGVNFFQGKLRQCHLPPVYSSGPNPVLIRDYEVVRGVSEVECLDVHSRADPAVTGLWVNPRNMGNFDNVFAALLLLFELSTQVRRQAALFLQLIR